MMASHAPNTYSAKLLELSGERRAFYLGLAILIVAWLVAFFPAVSSAASIWWISEYYTHGFVVLPAVIYASWIRRDELVAESWRPAYWVSVLLVFTLFIYLLGVVGRVSLFQHFAAFASLPLIVWLCLGNRFFFRAYNIMLLPLLAIPVGAELGPALQQLTAFMSEKFLAVTEITFIRRGLFFDVPNGTFLVAEECSGVRFLISSVAFALFYAELSYRSFLRKAAFLAFACIVPLVANGIRVTGTIMIGDRYGMDLASGVDHVVYGWFFFSFVLLAMVFIGRIFQESPAESLAGASQSSFAIRRVSRAFFAVASALLVFFLLTKFYSLELAPNGEEALESYVGSSVADHSVRYQSDSEWEAHFDNASEYLALQKNDYSLDIWWYESDSAGSELISSQNELYDPDLWSVDVSYPIKVKIQGSDASMTAYKLVSSGGSKHIVLAGYVVEGKFYNRPYQAKVAQVISRLAGRSGSGSAVVIAAPDPGHEDLPPALISYAESVVSALITSLP